MKRCLLAIFVFMFCFSLTIAFAQESVSEGGYELEKSRLLTQKGEKAELRGELEEAVEAYQDAYEACKSNVLPLLKLSNLYSKLGSYTLAGKLLSEIPLEKLNKNGQSEVLMLLGKVAINENSIGKAADYLGKALKINPKNKSAKVRLALINLMLGMSRRADELTEKEKNFRQYSYEDLGICLALDLHSANFIRAYSTCKILSERYCQNNPGLNAFQKLLKHELFLFVSFFPLFLSNSLLILYFTILFVALGLSASALSRKTVIWHTVVFVLVGVTLIFLASNCCITDVYYSLLSGYCYIYDGIWVLPKIIIASHLVALSLFLIFPMFKLLKENMRPATFELLGIWLFCVFFSLFVLSFQSRLSGGPRFVYMAIGLFFSILSALIMPLGKLAVYNISKVTGIQFFGNVSDSEVGEGLLSFSDAKLLQAKLWSLLDKGNLEEVVSIGRKVGSEDNLRTYPKLWTAYIVALICNEDYEIANKNLQSYSQVFAGTEYLEVGQIYEALLKSEKGDFPGAYKLVNAISEDTAKSLSSDDAACSLLVLARCCLNLNDSVQAHINLNKAFASAKCQLLKHIILAELAELDCSLNAKQAMQKWNTQLMNLFGEGKNKSYRLLIKSMCAFSEGKAKDAYLLAKESIAVSRNSKAVYWYGHLLCMIDKVTDAEALLPKMTIGSYSTERLMSEVTSRGLV